MPVYKFYRISHEGRVAGPPIVSDADTDAAALKQAKHYVDGFDSRFGRKRGSSPISSPRMKGKAAVGWRVRLRFWGTHGGHEAENTIQLPWMRTPRERPPLQD